MRALVTGANGFLGRYVASALLSRGHQVRALIRPAAKADDLNARGVTDIVRADLRSARDLERAFDGVDVLVHLAAAVTGGDEGMLASTVVGTERLCEAMTASTCRRIVLASSFAVYDWTQIHKAVNEDSPTLAPPILYERDGYSVSKTWQERVIRRFAAEHDWQLTILRPGFIWGSEHEYFSALGQQFGKWHVVIGPFVKMPMTHVENCADLFAVSAADPRAVGQTFNVVDGPGDRVWSFLGKYLRGMGEEGVRIPLPYRLVRFGVKVLYETVFRRNNKLPGLLIPCRFESRLKPLVFSYKRAQDVLGWKPPLTFEQCLARTFKRPVR